MSGNGRFLFLSRAWTAFWERPRCLTYHINLNATVCPTVVPESGTDGFFGNLPHFEQILVYETKMLAKTCQASAVFATRLNVMYAFSPNRYDRHCPVCRYCRTM